MDKAKSKIQGEGNKEADRRFREQESRFVQSRKGKEQIARAGELSEEQARKLRAIEEETKKHAKAEDPAVRSGSGGSDS